MSCVLESKANRHTPQLTQAETNEALMVLTNQALSDFKLGSQPTQEEPIPYAEVEEAHVEAEIRSETHRRASTKALRGKKNDWKTTA